MSILGGAPNPTVDLEVPLDLPRLAVSALIDEAELTPKPALVDQRGNGAHDDLDLDRLRASARSLHDGLLVIVRTATGERPSLALREELGRIGRDMERSMLAATNGSNAHRGAIWALGLLVAAAAQESAAPPRVGRVATRAAALARLPDRFAPRWTSNGERARERFGASGARGEAETGFPHALFLGLPTLNGARTRGVPEDHARLDALMAIMAHLDDTCLLHRGGRAALFAAKAGAAAVLTSGGTSTPAGLSRLHQLHAKLMNLWASPGGSGDLLAVTLFLDRLGNTGEPSWRH